MSALRDHLIHPPDCPQNVNRGVLKIADPKSQVLWITYRDKFRNSANSTGVWVWAILGCERFGNVTLQRPGRVTELPHSSEPNPCVFNLSPSASR